MTDERFEFIANNIFAACDLADNKYISQLIENSKDVDEFLSNPRYRNVYEINFY